MSIFWLIWCKCAVFDNQLWPETQDRICIDLFSVRIHIKQWQLLSRFIRNSRICKWCCEYSIFVYDNVYYEILKCCHHHFKVLNFTMPVRFNHLKRKLMRSGTVIPMYQHLVLPTISVGLLWSHQKYAGWIIWSGIYHFNCMVYLACFSSITHEMATMHRQQHTYLIL